MTTQTQLVAWKQELDQANFLFYPVLEMEEGFVPSTEDHVKRKKEVAKFMKRLNAMTPTLDALYELQVKFRQQFYNFEYMNENLCSQRGVESLVKMYAAVDLNHQNLMKRLKKEEKANPEAVEYYHQYPSLFETSVFDMMKADVEMLMPKAKAEYEKYRLDMSPDFTMTAEDLPQLYKEKMREVKEDVKRVEEENKKPVQKKK